MLRERLADILVDDQLFAVRRQMEAVLETENALFARKLAHLPESHRQGVLNAMRNMLERYFSSVERGVRSAPGMEEQAAAASLALSLWSVGETRRNASPAAKQ